MSKSRVHPTQPTDLAGVFGHRNRLSGLWAGHTLAAIYGTESGG